MPNTIPVPKMFPGERVFIIGGGPSARGVDWSLLKGKAVVACNVAGPMLGPSIARLTVAVDKSFVEVFRKPLKKYISEGGTVLYAPTPGRPAREGDKYLQYLRRLQGSKHWGISTVQDVVVYNCGCGGTAINVAYLAGAKEIVLIGVDCSTENGLNWHDEYTPFHPKPPESDNGKRESPAVGKLTIPSKRYYNDVTRAMLRVMGDLENLGVPCWNATHPDTPFPYQELESFL